MRVGAAPLEVYIDGKSVVRASDDLWNKSRGELYSKQAPPSRSSTQIENSCRVGQSDVIIRGIKKSFVDCDGLRGDEIEGKNLTAVIRSGRVVCVGSEKCETAAKTAVAAGVALINVNDGFLVPVSLGIVAT